MNPEQVLPFPTHGICIAGAAYTCELLLFSPFSQNCQLRELQDYCSVPGN